MSQNASPTYNQRVRLYVDSIESDKLGFRPVFNSCQGNRQRVRDRFNEPAQPVKKILSNNILTKGWGSYLDVHDFSTHNRFCNNLLQQGAPTDPDPLSQNLGNGPDTQATMLKFETARAEHMYD